MVERGDGGGSVRYVTSRPLKEDHREAIVETSVATEGLWTFCQLEKQIQGQEVIHIGGGGGDFFREIKF